MWKNVQDHFLSNLHESDVQNNNSYLIFLLLSVRVEHEWGGETEKERDGEREREREGENERERVTK